jgi:hypothetical protein
LVDRQTLNREPVFNERLRSDRRGRRLDDCVEQRFDVAGRLVGQCSLAQIDGNNLSRGSVAKVNTQDANTGLSGRQQPFVIARRLVERLLNLQFESVRVDPPGVLRLRG